MDVIIELKKPFAFSSNMFAPVSISDELNLTEVGLHLFCSEITIVLHYSLSITDESRLDNMSATERLSALIKLLSDQTKYA